MEENKETELNVSEQYAKKQYDSYAKQLKKLGIEEVGNYRIAGRWGVPSKDTRALEKLSAGEMTQWLQDPVIHEQALRGASGMLYNVSGEYKSMIQYLVGMARFYYMIDFVGKINDHAPNQLKEEAETLSKEFTKMNIAHEKTKIFDIVMREDVFYGYEIEDKHSYFILQLNPDYCRLSGKADGMWTFQFDFSYFDGSRKKLLKTYPAEFKRKYELYVENMENRWQELNFGKAVCYKFNENQKEIIPPLSTTFEGLLELNDYRKFKKANTKIQNYMLLHQKVPMFKDNDKTNQQNNFMIDSGTMMMFHSMLDESLPDEIGAVVSPMDIEPIQLDKRGDTSDRVSEVTRDIYNAAGINQYLFNPDKNSTAGLSKSIKKDESIVIRFYLQVARWMNKKVKLNHPTWTHWQIQLVPTTHQSEEEYVDMLIKLGSLGFPVVGALGAVLGYDISKIDAMLYIENDVFNFKDRMIPFASSHTMKANEKNDEGGRPTLGDGEISDSGQANRDSNDGVQGGEE